MVGHALRAHEFDSDAPMRTRFGYRCIGIPVADCQRRVPMRRALVFCPD